MQKKVLQIINSPGLGGAETIAKKIAIEFRFPIFCLRNDSFNQFESLNVPVFFGTLSKHYKYNLKVFLKLKRIIKELKIEILHVHLATSLFYAVLVKIFNPKLKLIYHEHGEIFRNNKLKILFKIFRKKINFVLAVSNVTKDEIIKKTFLDEEKIIVLHNFLCLENNFKQELSKKFEKNKILKIGFIGRLTEVKGCNILIKSLENLKIPFKCFIAGEGPQKEYLIKLTKDLLLEKNIVFLGYAAKENFYPEIDIIVIPSIYESFGLVFLEAGFFKVPAIISKTGGLLELGKDFENCVFFEPKNEADLQKKIEILYQDLELRKKIALNNSEDIKSYDFKEFEKKINNIYDFFN